jgi:hypothetical protein
MSQFNEYQDQFGNYYPNPLSFPIADFIETTPSQQVILSYNDIIRFDLFTYRHYGTVDLEDFLLWYNNIDYISNILPGTIIKLPTTIDIQNFFKKFSI